MQLTIADSFNTVNKRKKKGVKFDPIVSTVKLTSYHEFLGHPFLGEYQINTKLKDSSEDRVFKKEKSVFKDWKIDRPKALADGFVDDVQYWKISGVVKQEDE